MKGKTSKKKRDRLSREDQKEIIKACLDPRAVFDGPYYRYPQSCLPSTRPLRGRRSLTKQESACDVLYYTCFTENKQKAICTDPIQTLTRGEGIDSFIDKFFKKAKEIIPIKLLQDFVKEKLQSVSKVVCENERESVHSKQQNGTGTLRNYLKWIKASNHKNGLNLNTPTSKFFEHKQANKPFESEGISLSATRGLPGDSHLLALR